MLHPCSGWQTDLDSIWPATEDLIDACDENTIGESPARTIRFYNLGMQPYRMCRRNIPGEVLLVKRAQVELPCLNL